jgi:rhamnose transport system permease protein
VSTKSRTVQIYKRWEFWLVVLFIVINIVNMSISKNYMSWNNLLGAMQIFLDKGFLILAMSFIILSGQIDISVGSIIALSAVCMGVTYNAGNGIPMIAAVILCISVATTCGLINGLLITRFREIPAMIITLSTMIIYRGIASIMLEDKGAGKFPTWFSFLSWGNVGRVPFILIVFALFASVLIILMSSTVFGRKVRAIGSGNTAARFSGINSNNVLLACYVLMGFMSGIGALFLASKTGSTRPNMATGYEMDIIAMTVLGGFSSSGGKGNLIGSVIAVFIIGYLNYGLGIVNIPSQFMAILLGVFLLVSDGISNNIHTVRKLVKTRPDITKQGQSDI